MKSQMLNAARPSGCRHTARALDRRSLLKALAAVPLASVARATNEDLPPVRAITRGPKFHWRGYYDKQLFDPTNRYVVCNEVDFEGRSPTANDVLRVGMVDTRDGDQWTELGTSCAWNWQQGCMLQWLPGSKHEVIWNDREGDHFVSHILDVESGGKRTLPAPMYAVSPDARWAVAPDFRRLADMRPGYGYSGIPDPNRDVLAPDNAGIWRLDLKTGKQELIVTFADIAKIPAPGGFARDAKHWFNHLLFAPDGKRFVFLHRWKADGEKTHKTRMITARDDGKELFVLNQPPKTSHLIWRDAKHLLAFAEHPSRGRQFYVFADRTPYVEVIEGMLPSDGHCTYLPGNQWILCDTGPDKNRNQNPYLLHFATKKFVPLGHFLSPSQYAGEVRCDTHPSSSPDGRKITVDLPHAGGRQVYLIDINEIVG